VTALAYSPSGRRLFSRSADGAVCVYDVARGYAPVQLLHDESGGVLARGRALAAGAAAGGCAGSGPGSNWLPGFVCSSVLPPGSGAQPGAAGELLAWTAVDGASVLLLEVLFFWRACLVPSCDPLIALALSRLCLACFPAAASAAAVDSPTLCALSAGCGGRRSPAHRRNTRRSRWRAHRRRVRAQWRRRRPLLRPPPRWYLRSRTSV
jgi:hypothetical protein